MIKYLKREGNWMKWTGRFAGYNKNSLRKDLISGLIVGIIAIPLGMAFAIASGVKPEYGIYTTIIAGICISLFGGSKFQIGGPTGAFIPILFAVVMQYGYENLLIAGFMAGVFLLILGLCRLGKLISFIPRPVTIGFTAGIAVTIFGGQIANFLGLTGLTKHEDFFSNMREIVTHLNTFNIYSLITGLICFLAMILTARFFPKVPGSLIGLCISTAVAVLFFQGKVSTIESSFGAISGALPQFHIPNLTLDNMTLLIRPALVIAMLGSIESLLSAVVADGMTGTRHNSNRELIGQGIANMITPLFGGIPATGAIARTATNIKNGAVSPISGIVHGIVVLLVLLLFAPYASHIPLASMAPILMLVAWNMSERKHFMHMLKIKTSDSLVLAITFLLTVFADLTTAVEVGLLLAVVLFVQRMSQGLTITKVLPDPDSKHQQVHSHMVTENHDCPQISIYTVEGALFFGGTHIIESAIDEAITNQPRVVLLRMARVPMIDTTGDANVLTLVHKVQAYGGIVIISGIQQQPLELMRKTGLYTIIGANHFYERTGVAINKALDHLNLEQCRGCQHFAFHECQALSAGMHTASVSAPVQLRKTLEANI